jgi:hypothetical protein
MELAATGTYQDVLGVDVGRVSSEAMEHTGDSDEHT